jgi:hypothetical protein
MATQNSVVIFTFLLNIITPLLKVSSSISCSLRYYVTLLMGKRDTFVPIPVNQNLVVFCKFEDVKIIKSCYNSTYPHN